MSISILLIPDNNKKNLKRSLYHISRFTNELIKQGNKFELVVVDDGTCDINEEVEAFSITYFWKTIRPHYNSLEKIGINKLYNFHLYSESIGFEHCSYEKIIKISASTIPFQDTLKKLYNSNLIDGWNLINVYGIDQSIEDRIDLYGVFFPKETMELSFSNPIQTSSYTKYERPIFGITNKKSYWSNNFNYIENDYALSSVDYFLNEEKEINLDKLSILKKDIEVFSNII